LKLLRPYTEDALKPMIAQAVADESKKEKPRDAKTVEAEVRDTDNPDYKVYFMVNDGTSVVSTNIKPMAQLDAADDPFALNVDINRIDSGRSWTKKDANTLYGWYTGMAYLLPILGGLIADKLIGTHRSMIVGALLITLGHLALGVSGFGSMPMDAN